MRISQDAMTFIVACEEGRFDDIKHYVSVANVDVNAKGRDSEGDRPLLASTWKNLVSSIFSVLTVN